MNAELRQKYRETKWMILRDFPALLLYMPYKIGIRKDVIAHYKSAGIDVDRRALSRVFGLLTKRTTYLSQIIHGDCRFDLHGQCAGYIKDEHREIARSMLSKRRAERERGCVDVVLETDWQQVPYRIKKEYKKVRGQLFKDMPALWTTLPYRCGIQREIMDFYEKEGRPINAYLLKWILADMGGRRRYWQAAVDGTHKYDIFGQPVEEITEQYREYARQCLALLKERDQKTKEEAKRKRQEKKLAEEEKAKLAEAEKAARKAEKEAEQKKMAAASEAVTRPATEKPTVVITRRGRAYQRPENP